MKPLHVFVGWDSRSIAAYDVCVASLQATSSIPLRIAPLIDQELRARGLYWRPADPLASTEFTYTRFLTPHLAGEEGLAVYCDSDFLWRGDIAQMIEAIDPTKAVSCVQHEYTPAETEKMEGRPQSAYPRKNWSSLMVFNCAHADVRTLTPHVVNEQTGAYLHRLQWTADAHIGAIAETWNWLEGWSETPPDGPPNVIHFTRGGPWLTSYADVQYADLWRAQHEALSRA